MPRIYAFAVHVFTASGAGLALLALIFAVGGHWPAMFLCLGLALLIDGADGPLAREFKAAETLPRWSGERLDFVVDFTTYVFVPAYAITAGGLLPQSVAIACGVVIVITGALYFADSEMKTRENYFRGFPAVWNLIAFYLFVLALPPWLAALVIAVFAALTFVPVRFVHPLRVVRLRALNIVMTLAWAALAIVAVMANLDPPAWCVGGLALIALYFLGAALAARRA